MSMQSLYHPDEIQTLLCLGAQHREGSRVSWAKEEGVMMGQQPELGFPDLTPFGTWF